MGKITLVSVPYTIIEVPPLALAVLKGAVESHGCQCEIVDLGMDLFNRIDRDRSRFDELQAFFVDPRTTLKKDNIDFIERTIEQWADQLISHDADWIGISVFSYFSHYTAYRLCETIKRRNACQKIVVGGPGAGTKIHAPLISMHAVSSIEKILTFGKILVKRGLANQVILGDGEQALIDLLQGQDASEDFQLVQYSRDTNFFADFDGLDLADYPGQLNRGHTQLPIFTSKGCVRDCDFCDVNAIQQKFRFRLGDNIVNEMKYLADKYGLRDFIFLDSLVNGNLKNLRSWVGSLADFNTQNPDKKITWSASGWICRPIGQIPLDFYPTMAASGLQSVSIGAETGSNHVLQCMNKRTNVEALYFETEHFVKNDIKFLLLMLIGHWSERWEDFVETCHLIENMVPAARSGHLVAVNPGYTFMITEDTPADQQRSINGVRSVAPEIWHSERNPQLTVKERYFRILLFNKLIDRLGIPAMENTRYIIYEWLRNNINDIKKFNHTIDSYSSTSTARYYLEHFEEFLQLVHETNPRQNQDLILELDLTANTSNNSLPRFEIGANGSVIFDQHLQTGTNKIKLTMPEIPSNSNSLVMTFTNKDPMDTIVDQNGRILADKNIVINHLVINGIDLLADPDFYYQRLQYQENGADSTVKPGFWTNNSKLQISWQEPFVFWYNGQTNRNRYLDASIVTEASLPTHQSPISTQQNLLELGITELLDQL